MPYISASSLVILTPTAGDLVENGISGNVVGVIIAWALGDLAVNGRRRGNGPGRTFGAALEVCDSGSSSASTAMNLRGQ
jgi:hypothetical protein